MDRWCLHQWVETMPIALPERVISGVDCAERSPASRCSRIEPSGSSLSCTSKSTKARSPVANAIPQGVFESALTR
ncbi:MAG: hypothetical protein V7K44_20530 [Nostoc sp.]